MSTINLFYNTLEYTLRVFFFKFQFVKDLKSYPDSGWSSTHLTNLLHLCDKIEPEFDMSEAV